MAPPPKDNLNLLIVYHPDFSDHGYPVLKRRIGPAFEELHARGLLGMRGVRVLEPEMPDLKLVEEVHSHSHIRSVRMSGYFDVAMLSAGSVLSGARHTATDKALNAFCFTGAAGHHASAEGFWGFCYLNDVAIAIEQLRAEGLASRFAILDIDPHFGDGTRDILGMDAEVLHLNFYSGYSMSSEEGVNNIDFALPHDAADSVFLSSVDKALSAAADFQPDLLFVVFGHDNHREDYGGFALSDSVYADFAIRVRDAFPRRACYVLSGGSNADVARVAIGDVVEILANIGDVSG